MQCRVQGEKKQQQKTKKIFQKCFSLLRKSMQKGKICLYCTFFALLCNVFSLLFPTYPDEPTPKYLIPSIPINFGNTLNFSLSLLRTTTKLPLILRKLIPNLKSWMPSSPNSESPENIRENHGSTWHAAALYFPQQTDWDACPADSDDVWVLPFFLCSLYFSPIYL